MSAALSRALVALAAGCLGERYRDWCEAMAAELDVAIEEGQPLSFAAGCLITALRRLPRHPEGRWHLASHALALGLLVPAAFLQFACAIGLSSGRGGLYGILGVTGASAPLLAHAQLGAMPALLIIWLLLGIGHLQLAWRLLERDWMGVARAGALIAAATLTLALFMSVLLLDPANLRLLASLLPTELAFILAVANGERRLGERRAAIRSSL